MATLTSRRAVIESALSWLGLGAISAVAQDSGESTPPPQRDRRVGARVQRSLKRQPFHLLSAVDEIMSRVLEEHNVVGALIAIAKDGRLVLDRGYGLANRRRREPMSARTIGDIGSVTKPITACAILKLCEDGRLDIEARLVDALADLRPFPGLGIADRRFLEIKVHHLLYHGGGFGNKWAKSRVHDAEVERAKAFGERTGKYVGSEIAALNYRLAMSTPLKFTPGSQHSYSNFGFVTLRLVVERASGLRYEDFCQAHVLQPMGVRRMRLDSHGPIYFPGETHRYKYHADSKRYEDSGGGVGVGAAGNWIASASDLVRFLLAIDGARGKRFFRDDTMHLMLGPPPPIFKGDTSHRWPGLGFAVTRSESGLGYSKNGGVEGASTWIEHIAPGNIDWALHMNTTHPGSRAEADSEGPGPMLVAKRQLKTLFRELDTWPKVDLFED
jgi:CubicO group peptidase (beta-lactamase class C family)